MIWAAGPLIEGIFLSWKLAEGYQKLDGTKPFHGMQSATGDLQAGGSISRDRRSSQDEEPFTVRLAVSDVQMNLNH